MPPLVRRLLIVAVVIAGLAVLDTSLGGGDTGFHRILPDSAWRQLVLFTMVNVIIALSLNVINGMAGQFSIGHAGFVGIGAYTGALVAGNMHVLLGSQDPTFARSFYVMPPVLIASGCMAALFGLLVGLPSLRLKGDYLAIVTLGFAEIFRLLIATAQTGGQASGPIEKFLASLGGANGYAGPQGTGVPQYAGPFWIFGGVIVFILVAWRLKFSGWGRALRALREDEIAASAVGVDPTRYKVTSFVIAAAGAGIAGGLFATMQEGSPTVQPDSFTFAQSFDAITMVILGGSGSVSGAVVGGVFVTVTVKIIENFQPWLKERFAVLANWIAEPVNVLAGPHPETLRNSIATRLRDLDLNALRMVIYASILIGLMILRPEGLFGEREIFRRKRAGKTGGSPPAKTKGEDEMAGGSKAEEAALAADDGAPAPEAAS